LEKSIWGGVGFILRIVCYRLIEKIIIKKKQGGEEKERDFFFYKVDNKMI